ncbi:hypothetical protein PCASD_07850 [Puccinia coronata f. sp. avenae]|uniref:Uncharacterized protein n=1 Tax=Puccinia coronata f. sp. avenae TaxID=200324 RepID=A0A2N5TEZ9_9BASI|nr:hypothetical protein PCASD_14275 [Puccinia coronata f. sp. avenae]PLW40132.1 hypothetical protein PCASD_07850 [Puccinia coronata f. sp. avenae]
MEFLNNTAFEENCGTQDSWLTPLPGATKYVPFLDSQTQGSQLVTRSAATLSGAFPLILPTRTGANPKQNAPPPTLPTRMVADPKNNVPAPPIPTRNGTNPIQNPPPQPSGTATPTPGGHTPFSGIPPPPCCLQLHPRLGPIPSNPTALRNWASKNQFTSITFYTRNLQ